MDPQYCNQRQQFHGTACELDGQFQHSIRRFALQSQLFQFLDGEATAETTQRGKENYNNSVVRGEELSSSSSLSADWYPFCLEIPSPQQIEEVQKEEVARRAPKRKRGFEIYNGNLQSKQTRFFAAMTLLTALSYYKTVDHQHQHLYEILREGKPCCLYLDVEADLKRAKMILRWDGGGTEKEEMEKKGEGDRIGDIKETGEKERHSQLAAFNSEQEARSHPSSCDVPFDPSKVQIMLLDELTSFLQRKFPTVSSSFIHPSHFMVLDSSNERKFSQHYILRLSSCCFADNSHVGEIVKEFVAALREKAFSGKGIPIDDDISSPFDPHSHHSTTKNWAAKEIRQSLFYHLATDEEGHPSTTISSSAVSSCEKSVIDLAVYSRNRVLRCCGSCKLGKFSVLHPSEQHWARYSHCGAGMIAGCPNGSRDEIFLSSLAMNCWGAAAFFVPDLPSGEGMGAISSWNQISPSSFWEGAEEISGQHRRRHSFVTVHNPLCLPPLDVITTYFLANDGATICRQVRIHPGQFLGPEFEDRRPGSIVPPQLMMSKNKNKNKNQSSATTTASMAKSILSVHQVATLPPSSSGVASPFPHFDGFILSLLQQNPQNQPGFIYRHSYIPERGLLLYVIGGSRYCRNVGREHKSNSVYYIVDVVAGTWRQRCYDPDCKGFSSRAEKIPSDVSSNTPDEEEDRGKTMQERFLSNRTLFKNPQ